MARKDVELRIRARDEAKKTVEGLLNSLSAFDDAQKGVVSGATKVDSALGRLASAFKLVQTSASGAAESDTQKLALAYSQINTEILQLSKSLRDQKRGLRDTQSGYDNLSKSIQNTKSRIEQLKTAQEAAVGKKQKNAISEEAKQATQQLRLLETELRKQDSALQKQRTESDSTANSISRLKNEVIALRLGAREAGISVEKLEKAARDLKPVADSAGKGFSRLNQEMKKVSQTSNSTATSLANAANSTRLFGQTGERTTLNTLQRIRGQILSLTASYIGLFGVIRGGQSVLDTFRSVEAAQNRLGAVFEQNQAKISNEIRFLTEESSRLGISFSVVADEYSKFAIAADAANFSSENTRKIFTSISEAARVNKLTIEQTSGVYLALTQTISKGNVSSEELRRQLGDRLPGAFNIFADAIGVSTAKLDEMLRKGQVVADEETILKFANELTRRFGPQLSKSLESTTAELGRFQANLDLSRRSVAAGGFIASFTEALRKLNEQLSSEQGTRFFESLGAAAGRAIDLFSTLIENIDALIVVFKAVTAIKIAQFILSFGRNLKATSTAVAAANPLFRAMVINLTATSAALGKASVSLLTMNRATAALLVPIRLLSTAVRGLFAVMGGLPGLIAAAAFAFIDFGGSAVTEVNRANRLLIDHERILNAIRKGYEEAEEGVKSWATALEAVNITQVRDALENANARASELRQELEKLTLDGAFFEIAIEGQEPKLLIDIAKQFQQGKITIQQYQTALEEVEKTTDDVKLEKIAGAMVENLKETQSANVAIQDFTETLVALKNPAEAAEEVLNRIVGRDIQGETLALQKAFISLSKNIPEPDADPLTSFTNEMGRLDKQTAAAIISLQNLKRTSEQLGQPLPDDLPTELDILSKSAEAARAAFKSYHEELSKTPAGKLAEAEKDRITQLDSELRLLKFSNKELAVQKELENARLARSKEGLTLDVQTESAIRRRVEAIYEEEQAIKAREEAEKEADKARKDAQKATEDFATSIQSSQGEAEFSIAQAARTERERAIFAAEREIQLLAERARSQGAVINNLDQILARTRELAAAQFDAEEQGNPLEAAQERVNDLLERREAIQERIKFLQEQTDNASQVAAEGLRSRLEGVDMELSEAIDKAIELAQALGDETLVLKMETLRDEIGRVGEESAISGKKINDAFINNATSGFDTFAKRVAEGGNVFDSAITGILEFSSIFLREIAKMIAQQALFNLLGSGAGGGGGFGGVIGGLIGGLFHDGGVVGKGGTATFIPHDLIRNARRYHDGGVVGLRPDEGPAILKQGEEVLTEDNPRNIMNGGAGSSANVKIVNTIDSGSFVSEGLKTTVGEQAILNMIRANQQAFKSALGS